jgi:tetratricopeptide (TPR) repeat protein
MRLRRSQQASIGLVVALILVDADPGWVFRCADRAFQAGRYAEADRALKRLERLRRPSPVDRFLRAEVDVGLKREERALADLAAIPDFHPLAPLARLLTGQIEVRLGRTRPAEAALLAALRLVPRAVQPRKELVYIYNIQHRQAELDAQLAALVDLDALDFQYILHWTKTRNTIWKPSGDLPALEKFVATDPADRWSRLALAEALRRLDRLEEAESILAVLPPEDPEARAQRVLLLMDRNDFAATLAVLAEGPADHPKLARLRGQLALRRRDGHTALRHFRIAYAADPLDHLTLSGLGTALRMIGEESAAQPYLDAARRHEDLWKLVSRAATSEGELDPKLPHQIGMACAAIGRKHEARAWLKLAVQRDPLDAEGQQALFELEHGPASRSLGGQRPGAGPTTEAGMPLRGHILGVCDRELGRPNAAWAAWARVPVDSPLAASAALAQGRAFMHAQGRFIEAEAAYPAAARGTGAPAIEGRWGLAVILLRQGRLDEVRRLLEEIWGVGQERDRAAALRELWRLDSVIVVADELQPVLDQAARAAPDDDRVWLARAHLALQYGHYNEAQTWLDASLRKRPHDAAVWRAVLQWALAAQKIPETIGGDVAVLDYDGDGWLDVYLVQGSPFPPKPDRPGPADHLFRNRRDGTFGDATASSGIAQLGRGYGFGVTVGDYDGDGRPDLFITRYGSYALLRNQGDGTFGDVTERAGLGGGGRELLRRIDDLLSEPGARLLRLRNDGGRPQGPE